MKGKTKGRNIHGIVLLDKPVGWSSNQALQKVKHLFNARKAGHTGSLDGLASGLLPVCLGEATKIAGYLLDADKHYQVECSLGALTTTGDAEGEVVEKFDLETGEKLEQSGVEQVLKQFVGEIEQIPPMYSAIKHQGQPLYKLARQGITVERQARRVTIHHLELLDFDGERLKLEVQCTKGTYIRTLAEDIGKALGGGAYVSALRRLGVGAYENYDMHSIPYMQQLRDERGLEALDELILPVETALENWPAIQLSSELTHYVRQGQAVQVPRAPTRGLVRLFAGEHRFMGVGEVLENGRIAPRRLLQLGR